MKRIAMLGAALAVLLAACAPASSSAPSAAPSSAPSSQEQAKPFTDMAGREIQLPEGADAVDSVYCTDPVGSLTVLSED